MRWKSQILILWVLMFNSFCSSPASAEWLHNGEPVESAYAKMNGDFGAMIIFTDKPNELFDAWNKEGLTVKGSFVEKIRKNKTLVALILFSNCASDQKGMANVSVKFNLFDPANNLIKQTDELEVWINKPAPRKRDLELSVEYLAISIGKKYPDGLYSVRALVNDKNSGKKLDLERKFKVLK